MERGINILDNELSNFKFNENSKDEFMAGIQAGSLVVIYFEVKELWVCQDLKRFYGAVR